MTNLRCLLAIVFLAASFFVAVAQERREGGAVPIPEKGGGPQPDVADESYGPHARNVFDLWRVKGEKSAPLLIFIHGGGFQQGDKRGYWTNTQTAALKAGIAFASINYRYTYGPGSAPYPGPMHDSARAVQYFRHHAAKLNIDPQRIAAIGPSAGGGISLWLALHDDMADPASDDPVARQSSRLTAAIPCGAQASYDFRQIKKIVPGDAANITPLYRLFGIGEGKRWESLAIDNRLDGLLRDASPITHLTKDDNCPIFLRYNEKVPDGDIHHVNFGKHIKAEMDKLGLACTFRTTADYSQNGPVTFEQESTEFLKRVFGMK